MRTVVTLCQYIDNIAVPTHQGADNRKKKAEYAIFVKKAMETVLTKNQKKMLELYYLKGLTMTQIAQLQGINKSTVSKTIKKAKNKIKALSQICFF